MKSSNDGLGGDEEDLRLKSQEEQRGRDSPNLTRPLHQHHTHVIPYVEHTFHINPIIVVIITKQPQQIP